MQPQFVNDKYVSPLKYPKSDVACLPIMLVTTILLWTLNCPVNGRAAGPSEISPERASAGLRRAVAFYRARSNRLGPLGLWRFKLHGENMLVFEQMGQSFLIRNDQRKGGQKK
jgi:hypothetical protein